MKKEIIQEFTKKIAGLDWKWTLESFKSIEKQLDLKLKESIGDRITYLFKEFELDVFNYAGQIDFIEITVDFFLDPHLLSEIEYEEKIDEYFEKFELMVSWASSILGDPEFSDGAAASKFPDDQEAVWLALWKIKNACFMVQQKHEDRELPFRICIVLAPEAHQ